MRTNELKELKRGRKRNGKIKGKKDPEERKDKKEERRKC